MSWICCDRDWTNWERGGDGEPLVPFKHCPMCGKPRPPEMSEDERIALEMRNAAYGNTLTSWCDVKAEKAHWMRALGTASLHLTPEIRAATLREVIACMDTLLALPRDKSCLCGNVDTTALATKTWAESELKKCQP